MQDCRITGASWANASRDFFSGYGTRSFQHLLHAVACAATSEVINLVAILTQLTKRQYMSARQIDHINVIANARAVRRWIIIAKHFNHLALPGRNLQGDRYQVSFRRVNFTKAFARSRGVEVAECCELKPTGLLVTGIASSKISLDFP